MLNRAILISGPSELAGLLREFPDKYWNYDCIALTPDVFEFSKTDLNFKNVFYPTWAQNIRTFSIENYEKIKSLLTLIEEESSFKREIFFSENSTKVEWNYFSNYYLISMLMAARKFAAESYQQLTSYEVVEILCLNHSGEYYFDSSIQPSVLYYEFNRLGVNANLLLLDDRSKSSTYQANLYESMPNLFSENFLKQWNSYDKSVLIATSAIYSKDDQDKLSNILNSSYNNSNHLVYPVPLWPVINPSMIFNERCSVFDALNYLGDKLRSDCLNYVDWLTSRTENIFLEIFDDKGLRHNPLFRSQINRLQKRHLLQSLTYLGLKQVFRTQKPEMLALTNQDSSINGPLASAAMSYGIPLIIFPHGHILNWPVPCDCIIATEWWQPNPVHTLWENIEDYIYFDTKYFQSNYLISRIHSNRSWMILYNGVHENIFNSVAWPFVKKIVEFVANQARISKTNLVHRLKPGDQTPIQTFCELLELELTTAVDALKSSLDDLLFSTELVISIDEPSTALWEAISMGCAVVLVTDRTLTKESIADLQVLRPIDFETFTNLILSFVQNPSAIEDYKAKQQSAFLELRSRRLLA